jgi:hypothetical protein
MANMSGDRYNWYAIEGSAAKAEAKRVFGSPGRVARPFEAAYAEYDNYTATINGWTVVYAYGNHSLDKAALAASRAGRRVVFVHSETIVNSSWAYELDHGNQRWSVSHSDGLAVEGEIPPHVAKILTEPLAPEEYGRRIGELLVGFDPEEYDGPCFKMATPLPKVHKVLALHANGTSVENPTVELVLNALGELEPGRRVRLQHGSTRLTASHVDGKLVLEVCDPAPYVTDQPLAFRDVEAAFEELYQSKQRPSLLAWRKV